jgi:hypothetical protein
MTPAEGVESVTGDSGGEERMMVGAGSDCGCGCGCGGAEGGVRTTGGGDSGGGASVGAVVARVKRHRGLRK